ncbi:MAG TPA: hypothetical protein VFA67_08190 [Candidatus Sulfotelmatobacter sp.]|nr:hypothetical protein [Candidatus Sulfotelmatobacter sp.]
MTTKVFVVLAMFIIFGRCCVAEEIHGASDRRRELATRISSVTIIALLLSSLTFLKAGVLENSRRGLAPTLKNIWHASLWWKSPSGAPLPGPFGHSTTESTAANNHKLASAKEHKTHITTSLKKDKISEVRPSIEEKEPRLGIGVDPYQNVTHEQVAQWTIEESDKIAALANDYITGKRGPPLTNTKPDSLRFFFTTDYDKLYGSDVKDLRAEVLRRLGPPGKDPDEEDHWIMDIAIRDQSRASGMDPFLSPYDVRDYAPYLRNLGLRLKAKADSR